ncbi:hypothetical protein A4A49_11531 [Nicotiana attenuata]|uniref:Uncharacterized protein n=1 Tax=Nicotiana attenuata TaxID=49451 RepID=A0A314KS10_NICAT|nr:hypothetical protein A4A49_11531 [Nicotiana attenuata]
MEGTTGGLEVRWSLEVWAWGVVGVWRWSPAWTGNGWRWSDGFSGTWGSAALCVYLRLRGVDSEEMETVAGDCIGVEEIKGSSAFSLCL